MKLFPFSTLKFWYFSSNGMHGKSYFFQNTTAQKVEEVSRCNLYHWKDESIFYKKNYSYDNFNNSYSLQVAVN